ncbi:ATP-dependent DNA helicase DinG [Tatumella sp. JGM130]|uniref:ATP-dependent DNA helicase DinG n=1 Tax=Tatumella sp. JGM130 TaxID=2799797 RepID=UPI001BB0B578|nr:ATP-dependent DNA helicase DinG [Tatumella sp. JGM130]MBS0892547.1 ATP-dependent DNA helicase DinG [Tatumella sp. JGM130]
MVLTPAIKLQIGEWYKQLQAQVEDFVPRPPQRQMIAEVAKTLSGEAGRHLAIEAPTGVGKTLSYLIPGIAIARSSEKKLVISTANVALQDQIFDKDLPLLKKFIPDLAFTAAFGRRRYVCPRNLYFISDQQDTQGDLLYWLDESAGQIAKVSGEQQQREEKIASGLEKSLASGAWDGLRDHCSEQIDDQLWQKISTDKTSCLAHHCQWYRECPFFLARREIEHSEVIVANHALVMAALETDTVLPPAKEMLLVIDEGHHLPDVARDALEMSSDISPAGTGLQLDLFTKLIETLRSWFTFKSPPPLANPQRLGEHCATVQQLIVELVAGISPLLPEQGQTACEYRFVMGKLPADTEQCCQRLFKLCDALRGLCEGLITLLGEMTGKENMVRIHRGLLQLNRFLGWFESLSKLWWLAGMQQLSGAPVSKWLTTDWQEGKRHLWFHCAGIRVSDQLEKLLWRKVPHVILTSATLRSLNSFRRLSEMSGLNNAAEDRFVALDSPFDHVRQGKLVIPEMQYEPQLAQEALHIAEMARYFRQQVTEKKHTGSLVLFSSGRALQLFLAEVADLRLMLLVQGDQPRSRLIALHRQRVKAGQQSVLVGLQSFSEGLDLKGELLTQVHIHKISFPPVDSPVIVTEGEWLKSQKRYPFEIQSLPSASFTLIQQVGRLIRSHQCSGEVIIYDRRLLSKAYGSRLLSALPVFAIEQPVIPPPDNSKKATASTGKKTVKRRTRR